MAKLAFYTFGILDEAPGHPHSKGFVDRVPLVFESAEQSEGFVDRAGYRYLEGRNSRWGDSQASPRFTAQHSNASPDNASAVSPNSGAPLDEHEAATLSLWDDVESVYAFTYAGFHAEVLKMRDDWFVNGDYPAYVAWWIADDERPTRADGAERLERLHDNGPTAYAFDFKSPFDAEGQPLRMDRQKIQERVDVVRSHMRHAGEAWKQRYA